jgi:hypothetical protein
MKMSREIGKAAEQRAAIAHGVSRGLAYSTIQAPAGARDNFSFAATQLVR